MEVVGEGQGFPGEEPVVACRLDEVVIGFGFRGKGEPSGRVGIVLQQAGEIPADGSPFPSDLEGVAEGIPLHLFRLPDFGKVSPSGQLIFAEGG